ncbi:MAG: hypothetical protein KDD11_04135 [Acidobacteria bacterium]|nr:hypothetical protein [Acidobacteriota bacterium]
MLFGLTSLLLALGTVAWWPALLLTGPLAPPVVAVVHLLTLGFVTSTILGSLYLVSGFAFRARMQEGPADLGALVLYAIGTAWVVRGFFAGRPGDSAAGAPFLILGIGWVAWQSSKALFRSKMPGATKAPFAMAWVSLAATVALGVVQATDPSGLRLGGTVVDRVTTHAHVGLAGWVLVLIMAVGNRLLPMVLPSAMPSGLLALLPSGLTFSGAALFGAGRLGGSQALALAGGLGMVSGVAAFAGTLTWMLRHQKRPGLAVSRPDPPRFGALSSVACLLLATGIGVMLALGSSQPGLVFVYGVLVLLGFFGQLIVAIEQRLVPWLLWMRAYAAGKHRQVPPVPYRLPWRLLQALVLGTWAIGPWMLSLATLTGSLPGIRLAAAGLALSVAGQVMVLVTYGQSAYAVAVSVPISGQGRGT